MDYRSEHNTKTIKQESIFVMWVQSKVSEATESNNHKNFFDELDFTKMKYFVSSNETITK